jgi:hypothetical protein
MVYAAELEAPAGTRIVDRRRELAGVAGTDGEPAGVPCVTSNAAVLLGTPGLPEYAWSLTDIVTMAYSGLDPLGVIARLTVASL